MQENIRLSKEEYAALKKNERDEVFSLLDRTTRKLRNEEHALLDFFRVQSRFSKYSISNVILILAQNKDARVIKDFFDWSSREVQIRRGARSIKLIYGTRVETKDGQMRNLINVKSMFDISETSRRNYVVTLPKRSPEELIELIYSSTPVTEREYEQEHSYDALKDVAEKAVYADLELNMYKGENVESVADIASLMVMTKFGVEPELKHLRLVQDIFGDLNEKEMRSLLNEAKVTSGRVIESINREIYARMCREPEQSFSERA